MASTIIFLLVVFVALGSLFFMISYGALFLGAFSINKTFSLIGLIALAFSSVGFVILGFPWYYSLPLWIIPPIYAQVKLPKSKNKTLAIKGFWIGLLLLVVGLTPLAYIALPYVDTEATKQKMEKNKIEKQQKSEDRFEPIRQIPIQ